MPQFSRDWTAARAKVDAEGACRGCGRTDRKLEAAHTIGRSRDEARECEPCHGTGHVMPDAEGVLPDALASIVCPTCKGFGMVLWVNPLDIVPLCGPAADQQSCHYRYDHSSLDLLGSLRHDEQVRAVEIAGMPGTNTGIANAYFRLSGTRELPERQTVADAAGLPEW